jgi:hypothetical protein
MSKINKGELLELYFYNKMRICDIYKLYKNKCSKGVVKSIIHRRNYKWVNF